MLNTDAPRSAGVALDGAIRSDGPGYRIQLFDRLYTYGN
eukprot:SAG11_NODE_22491_length_405_cov_0.833333_1_plen_38_part_01